MIISKLFGFPVEEGLFEKVCDILKNEFSLADGHGESATGNSKVLVWEDEIGIGRYRVHCSANEDWKLPGDGKRYDYFHFHYWAVPVKFNREILLRDPMKKPLERILALSENRYETTHLFREYSVEEFERRVFGQS